jgi:hypothetical protein
VGTLFGKGSIQIKVIDMPGLFDTNDNNLEMSETIPLSIRHLINMEDAIKKEFNS